MMKKIIAALPVLIVILSAIFVSCYSALAAETEKTDETALMIKLGIFSDNGTEYVSDDYVTRGEFCIALGKILDIDYNELQSTAFIDTDMNSEEGKAVNILHKLGLINGYANGLFKPYDSIKVEEALTVLVNFCGYKANAEANGGYYSGYMMIAKNLSLLKGVDCAAGEELKRFDFSKILKNLLDVCPMQKIGVSDSVILERSEETILDLYLKTEKLKGRIVSNQYTSITGSDAAGKGFIEINGKVLKTGTSDIADFIGYDVEVYYDSDTETVLYYDTASSVETLRITPEMNPYYKNGKLLYTGDNHTEKSLDIPVDAAIIYNMKTVGIFKPEYFSVSEGEILCIKDKNGSFKTFIITNLRTLVVNRLMIADKKLYLKNDSLKYIDFSDSQYEIYDSKGNVIDLQYIREWDVISILVSEDGEFIRIYRNGYGIDCEIAEIGEDYLVTSDNKEYRITGDFKKDYPNISVGAKGKLYLGKTGYAAAFREDEGKLNIGFLTRYSWNGYEDILKVKILRYSEDKDSKFLISDITENITVDGAFLRPADVKNVLDRLINSNLDPIILYEEDSFGKITEIDTLIQSENENAGTSLFTAYNSPGALPFIRGVRNFAGKSPLSAEALVFYAPVNPEEQIDDNYDVMKLNLNNQEYDNFTTYKIGYDSVEGDAIVFHKSTAGTGGNFSDYYMPLTFVSKVSKVYDKNTEQVVLKIKGYSANGEIAVTVSEKQIADGLRQGDIIKLSLNARGEADSYIRLGNAEDKTIENVIPGENYNDSEYRARSRCIIGNVYAIQNESLMLTKYEPSELEKISYDTLELKGEATNNVNVVLNTLSLCETYSTRVGRIWKYDSSAGSDMCWSSAIKNDIASYITHGEGYSKVFVYSVEGEPTEIIILD